MAWKIEVTSEGTIRVETTRYDHELTVESARALSATLAAICGVAPQLSEARDADAAAEKAGDERYQRTLKEIIARRTLLNGGALAEVA